MPSVEIPVTLSEVLEIRGASLTENEAWGVLSQAAEAVQDLFIKGSAFNEEGISFVLTPDTVLLNNNGQVRLTQGQSTRIADDYKPPELQAGNSLSSDGAVDKMYVYSLGKTLHTSTYYKLTQSQVPKLSRNLDSLFGAMCESDPNHRLALVHVLEACTIHAQNKKSRKSSSSYVTRLHAMATGGNLDNLTLSMIGSSYGSDVSSLNISTDRPNSRLQYREGRHRRHPQTSNRSRSRSRSPERDVIESDVKSYIRNLDRDSGIGTLRESNNTTRTNDNFLDAQQVYYTQQQYPDAGALKTTTLPTYPGKPDSIIPADLGVRTRHSDLPTAPYPVGYEKYLQLKERQRRLRAIRNYGGGPLSFRKQGGESEAAPDYRSLYSLTTGTYNGDLRPQYDVKLGHGVDKDSIMSSEVSVQVDPIRTSVETRSNTLPLPKAPARQKHLQQQTNPPVQREFTGAEFAFRSAKQPIKIPIPFTGDSLKNPSHARRVTIVNITGQKYETVCDPSTDGRQLFDVIVSHIGLTEYYYFGLTYIADSEHYFIEADTKLYKVAPEGWKDVVKGHVPVLTFTLYIRVKYYVDSLTGLRHDESYHLLYLQLRRDIIEDRFYCTDEQALALAGLALQVEYGDYDRTRLGTANTYFIPEHYFSTRLIRKVGLEYLRQHAMEMHRNLKGHPSSQSELEYIKCIQKLPEYGIHFYKLLRNKNDPMSTVWVGISSHNLVLAENHGHDRNIVQRYPWQSTQKISFNKRRFSVQPKPDHNNPKPVKINLYSNTYRKGKYLLQLSTAEHRFLMRMRTMPSNQETLQGTEVPVIMTSSYNSGVISDIEDNLDEELTDKRASSIYDSSLETGSIRFIPDVKYPEPPSKYRSPPPYRNGLSYSLDDLRDPSPSQLGQGRSGVVVTSNLELHRPEYYEPESRNWNELHDDYLQHVDVNSSPDVESEREENPHLNNIPVNFSTPDQQNPPLLSSESTSGRHVTEVILKKEDLDHGIGMTIVGGESTGKLDLGIFVKSVVPDGPADRSGLISPGDRILAINSQSLEGVQHQGAVKMIRDSNSDVTLLLSQVRAPRTLRRKHFTKELSDELEEIAKSCDDIYIQSVNDQLSSPRLNPQLSVSLDDIDSRSRPPKKPVRTRKTQEIEEVGEILRQLSQSNQNTVLDHVIVEPANQEKDYSVRKSPFESEEIITGNLVNHQSSRRSGSIDIYGEAVRPDNRDYIEDDVNTSQELQLVGEIAAMPIADDSSSDSDFDSAIHDVIQGTTRKYKHKHHDDSRHNCELSEPSYNEVEKSPHNSIDDFYSYFTHESLYEIELRKGTNGLGFSIQGGVDVQPSDPIHCIPRVKKVFMLGAAAESGIIQAGDVIFKVDYQPLQGLTRNEIIEVMHTTGRDVRLLMCRPDPSILPPIERANSIDSLEALLHSHQVRLSAATLKDCQDSPSESENSTVLSGRSSPLIPVVNRIPNNHTNLAVSPDTNRPTTPVLRRCWTEQQIASPPADIQSRDTSGILIRSQSEQAALASSPSKSPPANYFAEEKRSGHVSSSMMSPYGNFENLAALCSSDDGAPHDSSEAGSAWSDIENITKNSSQQAFASFNDSNLSNMYTSPKLEPRNSTLLDDVILEQVEPDIPTETESEALNREIKSMQLREEYFAQPASISNSSSIRRPEDLENISLASVSADNTNDYLETGETTPQPQFKYSTLLVEDYTIGSLPAGENNLESSENSINESRARTLAATEESVSPRKTLERENLKLNQDEASRSPVQEQAVIPRRRSTIETPMLRRQEPVGSDQEQSPDINGIQEQTNDAVHADGDYREQYPKNSGLGEFEVTLRKKDGGGLGFAVAGSGKSIKGCYIKAILQDPAQSDGRLQSGDQLLEVNGEDMKNMNHFEAVTLLRQTPQLVRIKVFRPEKSPLVNNGGVNNGVNNQLNSQDHLKSSDQPVKPVKLENDGGTVEKKGSVRDIIKTLESRKYSPRKDSDTDSRSSSGSNHESGILRIKLDKESMEGFGFSLVSTENDNITGVFIKTIKSGGVADRDGRLHVGDRIIQVNGESVLGYNHGKVINMLRQIPTQVTLTVSRSSNKLLNLIQDDTNQPNQNKIQPISSQDSLTNLIDVTNETDDDINSLAGDAENFLRLNGTMNDSTISLMTPRDNSTDQKTPRYDSPRKIPLSIPDKLTDDWLESLPLLSIREDGEEFVGEVLHSLVEKVEQEEPFEEFRNLCQLKPTDDCTVSNLNDNKIKNRYRNVLPYDVNRVKLKGGNNDYINASHINIDIEDSQLRYIACQGPLPNTVDDFWSMCWQEDVSIVAMLTLDVESRRVKCHRYWPDSPEETLDICDGEYEVNLITSQSLNDIDIRYINITHCSTGKIKHIIHLNYTTWPDHGTPLSAIPILQFLRLLHLLHTGGPIVVHCSAGIGRSGSLITIDIALLYMEHMLPFNIFEIVKNLRQEKYGMIQTKDQYLFCYTACMQVLLSVAG